MLVLLLDIGLVIATTEDWFGKSRYARGDYSGDIIRQWHNRIGYEFRIRKKVRVQVEEDRKAHICEKCRQFVQQGRTNQTYGRG